MKILLQILILIALSSISFSFVAFGDINYGDNVILRQAYRNPGYLFWTKIEGKDFCQNTDENKKSDILKTFAHARVNVVYLENVDILTCKEFIPDIATLMHENGLLLAMDIIHDIDKSLLLGEGLDSLQTGFLDEKLKDVKDIDSWVSYLIFDNKQNLLTYSERRSIQIKLRDIFSKSFIGFRFFSNVSPTPENKHPMRQNIDWSDILPKDDDGDFIITPIPVSEFRRTLIITDNVFSSNSNGQFINAEFIN